MSENRQVKWYAIDVLAERGAAEAVESGFNLLDSIGTEIDDMRKRPDELVTITGYFNDLPDPGNVRDHLEQSLRIYGLSAASIRSIKEREVEDADWLAEWKRHWKPTKVGKFVIAPPWSEVVPSDKIIIRIEPNMAFGTGTHETTKLCLETISRDYRPDQSFLDVGTGTGILAIAAAKLSGKSDISAFETDADSVTMAIENARLNGVSQWITFIHGTIDETTSDYDFVCANLTLDVIDPLLPLLLAKARQQLVLSGILAQQKGLIVNQLSKLGIRDPIIKTDGEWISVLVCPG